MVPHRTLAAAALLVLGACAASAPVSRAVPASPTATSASVGLGSTEQDAAAPAASAPAAASPTASDVASPSPDAAVPVAASSSTTHGVACSGLLGHLAEFQAAHATKPAQGPPLTATKPVDAPLPRHKIWTPVDMARWRAAIESYVPTTRRDHAFPLSKANAIAFAGYLNRMHERIHTQFADAFLPFLDSLPGDDPRDDADLSVQIEIVIDSRGAIARMGVLKLSTIPEFDAGALEAISRAQPFGSPPSDTVSGDGKTYVRWTLFRDERCACSSMGALPYLLP